MDVKDMTAQDLRMSLGFAKLSPYLLAPNGDEVMIPERLKDVYIRGIALFKKENTNEVQDYMEEEKLIL